MTKQIVLNRWPRLLSVDMAAEYLSISPKTIRNRLSRDTDNPFPIKPKRYGKRIVFDINDLDEFAEDLPYV